MNKADKKEQVLQTSKLHKQFLNTNFNVPVIQREKLPQLFTSPPIPEV